MSENKTVKGRSRAAQERHERRAAKYIPINHYKPMKSLTELQRVAAANRKADK